MARNGGATQPAIYIYQNKIWIAVPFNVFNGFAGASVPIQFVQPPKKKKIIHSLKQILYWNRSVCSDGHV